MAIRIALDEVMRERGATMKAVSAAIGVSQTNLSRLRRGRIRSVRFSTLEGICRELGCQPGDLLRYDPDDEDVPPPR